MVNCDKIIIQDTVTIYMGTISQTICTVDDKPLLVTEDWDFITTEDEEYINLKREY